MKKFKRYAYVSQEKKGKEGDRNLCKQQNNKAGQ